MGRSLEAGEGVDPMISAPYVLELSGVKSVAPGGAGSANCPRPRLGGLHFSCAA